MSVFAKHNPKAILTGLLAASLIVAPGGFVFAQGAMQCHSMSSTIPAVSPDKLPPPLKIAGIGNAHIPITTSKPEAQLWFDQGLNLLHDFWDYESERAFEQAVRVDDNCAMCYWGLYQAESSRGKTGKDLAKAALDKAASLKDKAGPPISKSDQLYIEAAIEEQAADQNEATDDGKPDTTKEVAVLRKLVAIDPKSTQARIFLAEALRDGYDDDGKPRKGMEETRAILQQVLKDAPEDSAANHYWIHAVEASHHPEEALPSAAILGRLAPASGHMVHMPGHIYYRTGDYVRAHAAFKASTEVDEHYMHAQHVGVDDDWNYVHNLMYSIANQMEQGHLSEATTLSEKLNSARGQSEASLYPWSPRDSISRLDVKLPVALRSADWASVLNLLSKSKAPGSSPNLEFLATNLALFATGMQALGQQDMASAQESSTQMDAALWRLSQSVRDADAIEAKQKTKEPHKNLMMPDALAKPLVSNLSIMSLELRASILLMKKAATKDDISSAKKLFASAAQEEKDLGYHEPPAYIRPVAETEAAMLMNAGAWEDARAAYKRALADRPNSGFPLYGIARSSEESGDASAATSEYATFATAWKDADSELPQIAHAKAFLAQHQVLAAQAGVGTSLD